jgi:hypothetical protein
MGTIRTRTVYIGLGLGSLGWACGEPAVVVSGDGERARSFASSMAEYDCGLQAACEAEGPVPVITDLDQCVVERTSQMLDGRAACDFYPEQAEFCLDVLESLDCGSYFLSDWWTICRVDLIWRCPV